MVKYIETVNKRTELLMQLLFLSELLRDYINGPEESIEWITTTIDSRVTSSGINTEFNTIKDGLNSPYSKSHAIELGRKTLLRYIEDTQNQLGIIGTELNNDFNSMRVSLQNNYDILKGNLDLSTIYSMVNQSKSNRLLEEYFAKTLEATIKLQMIGNKEVSTIEYLGKLCNVVKTMVDEVWNDFDTVVSQYKSQTEYVVTKYNQQQLNDELETPLNTFTKTDKPEEPISEPDPIEVINRYIEKVESTPTNNVIESLSKVLESLDNISPVLNEKITSLVEVLTKLTESEFKQFTTMVNNFVELGPKNYEKINGTDDEYKQLLDYNLRYIPTQDKVDKYFMIGFYNTYIGTNIIIKVYYYIAITIAKIVGNGTK